MMKKIKLFALVALASTVIVSCKKDDDTPVNVLENPAQAAIESKAVIKQVISSDVATSREIGNEIAFVKNGKVTQLGCRYPQLGDLTVTLWNLNTKAIVAQAVVTTTDVAKFAYKNITPVAVSTANKYVLSIHCPGGSQFYAGLDPNNANLYPFTSGNITYKSSLFKTNVNASTFPETAGATSSIGGIADLTFDAD